jgi:hypothetical protein
MEEILLLLLEFAAEFFLEFFAEGLIDAGSRVGGKKKPMHPILAFAVYSSCSVVLACASLQIFPRHFIRNPEYRMWNVLLTPLIMGVLMGEWGGYRRRNHKSVSRLDTYVLGFSFALIFALIRWRYAG